MGIGQQARFIRAMTVLKAIAALFQWGQILKCSFLFDLGVSTSEPKTAVSSTRSTEQLVQCQGLNLGLNFFLIHLVIQYLAPREKS